jgi:hypothetical protein
MDPDVAERLRREFSDGEEWGWRSLKADHPIFWSHQHQRLTPLSEEEILIALIWKRYFARQWGADPHLYYDEKKLWQKHFKTVLRAAAVLLLALWYNYFGDRDHDGIPDVFERFTQAIITHEPLQAHYK